jgi:hypothetical protein
MSGAPLRIEFAPALMTRELAAFYISGSLRDLDRLRESKEITPVGEGRRVKYRKSELDSYIERIAERPATRGQNA